MIPLAEALAQMPNRQQPYTAMVARMSYVSPPLGSWSALIDDVVAFVDPLLADADERLSHWDTTALTWR